ncbi:hypothetical protein D3C73_1075780 [compost metagenome]
MARVALGPGATGLGVDDGLHRGPAVVRDGPAKRPGATVGDIGRDDHVGGVHGRLCPDALAVPAGPGVVARAVYRQFNTAAQRLVLFIRAGRLHGGDHCLAGHQPSVDGVRSGRGALHGNQPGDYLRHGQQCLALAAAGGTPIGRAGPGRLAKRDQCRAGDPGWRWPGAQRPAGNSRKNRRGGRPARTRLVRRRPGTPTCAGHQRFEPEAVDAVAHCPFGAPAVEAVGAPGVRAIIAVDERGAGGAGQCRWRDPASLAPAVARCLP